jgi:hypothetical protein
MISGKGFLGKLEEQRERGLAPQGACPQTTGRCEPQKPSNADESSDINEINGTNENSFLYEIRISK